ncbi:MAG: ComF family protein [Bacteroidota bacterium]
MLRDFISLIYPHICMSCGKSLFRKEACICTYCKYHLPRTNFHLVEENPISRLFWGKVNINTAASYYHFNKGSKVQRLIHRFKYNGQKEIGIAIGEFYGNELRDSPLFNNIDTIIPVPLHQNKKRKRGYNQSEFFAGGLAKSMGVKLDSEILFRSFDSKTQTRKTRFERWRNVEAIFQLKEKDSLKGKHILLVDDVLTTGSTLEACAHALLEVPGTKVSIVTMAFASN